MMGIRADMHIHTVLSPCAERDMRPAGIIARAAQKGLSVIAVCDHNSARNVRAVIEAAAAAAALPSACPPVSVIAGIEITTAEEAHVLGLFPSAEAACEASSEIGADLPLWRSLTSNGPYAIRRMPDQEIVNAAGATSGIEEKMLAAACRLTLSQTVDLIHAHGGLAVAAHVDRRSFSIPSQLGFLPPDVPLDALEISAAGVKRGRASDFSGHGLPLVSSSDSHFLDDIGSSSTLLEVEEPSFAEIALALAGARGRRCAIA